MSESENPLIAALRLVFGPVVKLTKRWPPVLAFGVPTVVAVLLIAVLSPFLPTAFLVLFGGVIFMILAAYIIIAYIEIRSCRETVHQGPCATITRPIPNQNVDRTILCAGTASGIDDDKHLWLAVETCEEKVRIWPKDPELFVKKGNRWENTIFEDGFTRQFSISVWLADTAGQTVIQNWLGAGRLSGKYPDLNGIDGAVRLTRVDGLTLKGVEATQTKTKTETA